jgi:hypothetical protein
MIFGREKFIKALVGKHDKNFMDIGKLSSNHCVVHCSIDPDASHRMLVQLTDMSRNGTRIDGILMGNIRIFSIILSMM